MGTPGILGSSYTIASTGASVSLQSAVNLIYQYCDLLPRDPYSELKPIFTYEQQSIDNRDIFVGVLHLPNNCPFLEIRGDTFQSSKLRAKQEVCMAACIKLHKLGALDDNLIPAVISARNFEVDKQKETQVHENKLEKDKKRVREFNYRTPLPYWDLWRSGVDDEDGNKHVDLNMFLINSTLDETTNFIILLRHTVLSEVLNDLKISSKGVHHNITFKELGIRRFSIDELHRCQHYFSALMSTVVAGINR